MAIKLNWLKEKQKTVLERGYLDEGETPLDRYTTIVDTIKKYCEKLGYKGRVVGIEKRFERYISNNWVSFATPVLKSFGKADNLSISCNKSILDDSLSDIYKGVHEIGMLAKHGAGTSVNFSNIRPIGSTISTGGKSNSVLDWVELYSDMMSKTAQNCYKDNVEVLTDKGWKLFKDLDEADLVASVLDDDSIELVKPLEYFEYDFNGELFNFKDSKNIDISVTDNHNMVFKRRGRLDGRKDEKGKYLSNKKEIKPNYISKKASNMPLHRDIFMFKSSYKNGSKELSYKERLLIAYQADGSLSSKNCMRFHFTKIRKIKRLRDILQNLDYKFTERVNSEGNTVFHVNFKEEPSKFFNWVDLTDVDTNWGKQFLEELSKWDSSDKNTSYNSFNYMSVDEFNINVVQSICALSGFASTKTINTPKKNKQPLFHLYVSEKRHFGLESMTPNKEKYTGKVYCVEVPSNKLLVRSNGRTLVCGNSQRRGFLTAYLSADHPEIMEFLKIGTSEMPKDKERFFSTITTGVTLPNGWRDDLKQNPEKRKIFTKILNTRKEAGFPYIVDLTNANKDRPQVYKDKGLEIKSSNICTEIIEYCDLEKTFSCCLSSVNAYWFDDWKDDPDFIFDMNIMLDCVIEEYIEQASKLEGFEKAVKFCKEHRAIGLGLIALHSYFQKNGMVFGEIESSLVNREIYSILQEKSLEASKWMAENWGEPEIMKGTGLRNSTRLAQAPTKTTSYIMGGDVNGFSEGAEVHLVNYGEKKVAKIQVEFKVTDLIPVLDKYGKDTKEVWNSILERDGSVQHLDFLSDHEKAVFRTFSEVSQYDVIRLAAERQPYIDQGQSINLMIHPDMSSKDLIKLHLTAFEQGLKSLYYQYSINAAQKFNQKLLEGCSNCEA